MASSTGTSDPTGLVTHSDRLSARAAELAYSEMARLLDRTTGSKKLYERAALCEAISKAPAWNGTQGRVVPSESPLAGHRNLSATRLRPYKPRKKAED